MRRAIVLFTLLALVAVGCTDDDGDVAIEVEPSPTSDVLSCTNAEVGYTLSYPRDWYASEGGAIAACTAFDPREIVLDDDAEPFDPAIVIDLERSPFTRLTGDDAYPDLRSQASTTIDGRAAAVIEHVASGHEFLPDGTTIYLYAIDLGEDGTLVARVDSAGQDDFVASKRTLDEMMDTLDFDSPTSDADPTGAAQIVARFESAGRSYVVSGFRSDEGYCFSTRVEGAERSECGWIVPPDGSLSFRGLEAPEDTLLSAGATAIEVARVVVGLVDGGSFTIRPVRTLDGTGKVYVAPAGPERVERVSAYNGDGRLIAVVDEAGTEVSPLRGASTEPESQPYNGDGFEVMRAFEATPQASFDRVVLSFRGSTLPGFEIGYRARPIRGADGREVDVAGGAVLVVELSPSSTRDPDTAITAYRGPDRMGAEDLGTEAIVEAVRISDEGGDLVWAFGVSDRMRFRVDSLASPPRLVIDVAHAPSGA